jgi:uncharacterized protein (DUF2235 family)
MLAAVVHVRSVAMPKNIIICADGTGNSTIKGRGTNVFKVYEAVDGTGHRVDPRLVQQVAIYHDGVGTEVLKWVRIVSGATGWGLSRNVKQLYGELARVYEPGDRIYLFGFSRGAFTVRTLAGLITTCGILDLDKYRTNRFFWKGIRSAYVAYRRKYQTWLSKRIKGTRTVEPQALRNAFSVAIPGFEDPSRPVIHFIGVWDTVDAVGLPFRLADIINQVFWRFKFPDTRLSQLVGHACQALALDEARQSFAPLLWQEQPGDAGRIEQVWFAGVHSNVGGGYPRQGMSLVALDWMMTRAEAHGLRFLPDVRQLYRGTADVNDKGYDSRSGLGVFYRWKPRNVERLCSQCDVQPKVHRTVFERIARNTDGYAPGAVPTDLEVISTTLSPGIRGAIASTVSRAFDGKPPLLRQARLWRIVGLTGYWLLLAATFTLLALILAMFVRDARATPGGWRAATLAFASTVVSSHWINVILRTAWHHPSVIVMVAASLGLLLWADRRLDAFYSQFWHGVRARLRDAL